MENFSFSAVFDAFHFISHNETYAIPGFYDIKNEDATWILAASIGIFTMTTGLAFLEVGTVSAKNRVNCMMKNVVDM
jgi:Ammonium Transporter Family